MTFEIEGLMNDNEIKWKKIPCHCNHDSVETEYPIAKCIHCQCQHQEDMLPRESYTISYIDEDDEGNQTGEIKTHTVNKIKINRGKKYDDIKGWYAY
jgi:hypothetical protein